MADDAVERVRYELCSYHLCDGDDVRGRGHGCWPTEASGGREIDGGVVAGPVDGGVVLALVVSGGGGRKKEKINYDC